MRYRPDIDGLRAVAVIPVLLFHARVPGLTGGFVGVDVFFVISGFLITSFILGELEQGRFSLLGFWERRARRILPALTVVTLASLAAGCWVLAPADLERLAQQVFAQSIFASNFLFWQQSDYFGPGADTLPLLHTWSLAVEEQFYLLFPLLLAPLARSRPQFLPAVLVAATLASFALGVLALASNHVATAFYLLPTRAWELLLGALLALPAARRRASPSPGQALVLSTLGLAAIAIAVFTYDGATPFPGVAALLPAGGTALLIHSNAARLTAIGRVLSAPPLVLVGLISYPLYLWHWPLLVFTRYLGHGEELPVASTAAVIGISMPIAYASWRFIEAPFRRRRLLRARAHLLGGACAGLALLAASGLWGYLSDGLPGRLPPAAAAYAAAAGDANPLRPQCHSLPPAAVRADGVCRLGPQGGRPLLVSWGDSHADAIMPLLERFALERSVPIWHASSSSCPPLLGITRPEKALCDDFNREMLALVARSGAKHVLLTARWAIYVEGRERDGVERSEPPSYLSDAATRSLDSQSSKAVFQRHLGPTVDALLDLGVDVWLVRQVPEQRFNVPARLVLETWRGGDPGTVGRAREEYERRQRFVDSQFDRVMGPRVHRIDPASLLCAGGFCRVEAAGRSLYWDDDHVSTFGASWLRPVFAPLLGELAGSG